MPPGEERFRPQRRSLQTDAAGCAGTQRTGYKLLGEAQRGLGGAQRASLSSCHDPLRPRAGQSSPGAPGNVGASTGLLGGEGVRTPGTRPGMGTQGQDRAGKEGAFEEREKLGCLELTPGCTEARPVPGVPP